MQVSVHEQMILCTCYKNSYLCDVFSGASGEVRRRESESAVCPGVIRLEVDGYFLFPLIAIAEI